MADEKISALDGIANEFLFAPRKHKYDVESFLHSDASIRIRSVLLKVLKQLKHVKIHLCLQVHLTKLKDNEMIILQPWFPSKNHVIISSENISSVINTCFDDILGFYDAFLQLGSGWILSHIINLRLSVCQFIPLRGGCLNHKLPKIIKNKKAVVDIRSPKGQCFIYAVLAGMCPNIAHPERYQNYKRYLRRLNCTNIAYPVKLTDISRFEKDNKISVNVYSFEKILFPVFHSDYKASSPRKEVDILLINQHYFCIRNLSRLIGNTFSTKHRCHYVCRSCLSSYATHEKLLQHHQYCDDKGQCYTMPPRGSLKRFENYRAQYQSEFCIYYDIESLLIDNIPDAKAKKKSVLEKLSSHHAISICAKRVSIFPEFDGDLFCYTGTDCVQKFFQFLENQWDEIQCIHESEYSDIDWTARDMLAFETQKSCSLCKVEFSSKVRKVADHSHLKKYTNFRSALCNRCNITYAARNKKIPVIAHCSNHYDTKLLLSEFFTSTKKHKVKILAKNKEKFHCMFVDQFVFIDSYSFLQGSLQTLAESLKSKDIACFKHVKQLAKTPHQLKLLLRKGCFSYQYLDCESKLMNTQLPNIEDFYDIIKETGISADEYKHAQEVWRVFGCQNLKDYLEIYVKTDVLLLIDIFENFRKTCYKNYGLDAAMYISLPHLAFDALLKMSGIELELLTSIDKYNFINKSIRGGVAGINHRYATANNKYMTQYDPTQPSEYLMLYDVTNLYGYIMASTPMPVKDFVWLTDDEIKHLDIENIDPYGAVGYFLEVDLYIDKEIHDFLNSLPPASEKLSIPCSDWSDFTRMVADTYGLPFRDGAQKLVPTLNHKKMYVLHHTALRCYLKLGLRLTKIHKVLSFHQELWMKEFIEFNSAKRKSATNKFDQDLYKLMINR